MACHMSKIRCLILEFKLQILRKGMFSYFQPIFIHALSCFNSSVWENIYKELNFHITTFEICIMLFKRVMNTKSSLFKCMFAIWKQK